jgi:hypothetical protein
MFGKKELQEISLFWTRIVRSAATEAITTT